MAHKTPIDNTVMIFDGTSFRPDSWCKLSLSESGYHNRHGDDCHQSGRHVDSIFSLADLKTQMSHCSHRCGVLLVNDSEIDDFFVSNLNRHIDMIALSFASPTDGRPFSYARSLRRRAYTGILRGVGRIIPDLAGFIFKVGFDEIEVDTTRFPIPQWHESMAHMPASYQDATRL